MIFRMPLMPSFYRFAMSCADIFGAVRSNIAIIRLSAQSA
jgi:hypothetical protein